MFFDWGGLLLSEPNGIRPRFRFALDVFAPLPPDTHHEVSARSANRGANPFIHEIICGFADNYGVELTNLDGEDDHVHILFRAKPTTDLVKFINTVKGATARRIRNEYADELKTDLWGDSFWNDSYCLISTGQVSLDMLKQYVDNQRE